MLFFIGFNMHEPIMQSMASKYAKIHQKGLALGIFNSFGYIGTFTGAVWGGYVLRHYGITPIAIIVAITCIAWVFLIITLDNPIFTKNIYIEFGNFEETKLSILDGTKGIVEWYKNENDETLIIKYESKIIEEEGVLALVR
jgi:MFS family permease